MARNLKKDYLKKLIHTEAPNGYKFDLSNYVYNPHVSYDYPSFSKVIAEDSMVMTIRRIYYIKYFDGTGVYKEEVYTSKKEHEGEWEFIPNAKTKELEKADRFSLKKLLSFC